MNCDINFTSFLHCFLFIGLSFGSSFGQATYNQKYGTENDYKRLYFLNIQYIQSWVRSDTATYNQLLWADDFVHQNSADGLLYPKKQLFPIFGEPRFEKINYFYPENVTIQFITHEAALVFAITPFQGMGQTFESSSQYNDIYVKRNGIWICVSANVTKIATPNDAPIKFTKTPQAIKLISYVNGSETDKEILKSLNVKHAESFAKSNSVLLDPILAEDFILLSGNGMLYKKQEVLNSLKNRPANDIDSYSVENYTVRFVAPDVAMLHAAFIAQHKDSSMSGTQYNDIYVKRDGKWLCVSGNNTPLN